MLAAAVKAGLLILAKTKINGQREATALLTGPPWSHRTVGHGLAVAEAEAEADGRCGLLNHQ